MSSGGPEPPGGQRHEPLPGVLGLPGYLYRRLSRRARLAGALVLVALVVAAIAAVPLVRDSKREGQARDREQQRQNVAERRREVVAQQRPRYGRSRVKGEKATFRALERAMITDVARRARSGEVNAPARRTDCISQTKLRFDRKKQLSCTLVTSDIKAGKFSTGATVGYSYQALLNPRTGAFAFCKVVGQPGEGSYTRRPPPPVSRDCG